MPGIRAMDGVWRGPSVKVGMIDHIHNHAIDH